MPKLGQRGAVHLIIILILLAGIVGIVYLVTAGPLKIFPKATVSDPLTPTTSFTLSPSKSQYAVGEEVEVKLTVRSDIAAANLFAAKISYDPQYLRLNVDKRGAETFIKNWVEQDWSDPGKISLVGGVPDPGFQTQVGSNPAMATLYFTALKPGNTTLSFDDASEIFSNANNTNILVGKQGATIALSTDVTPTPSSSPLPGNLTCTSITSSEGTEGKTASGDRYYIINGGARIVLTTNYLLPDYNPNGKVKVKWNVNGGKLDATADYYQNGWTAPQASSIDQTFTVDNTVILSETAACPKLSLIVRGSAPTPVPTPTVCSACNADINQDGTVTILDFSALATCFNKRSTETNRGVSCSRPDINRDGAVTILDFSCLADKFNKSCSQGNVETGIDAPMDQATRRSLQAQLEGVVTSGTGDGNGDGKIDLTDLSILFSDFNKIGGSRRGVDLNGDGIINSFDFGLMRNLLIEKKVIRG